jgi:hypothetical protein
MATPKKVGVPGKGTHSQTKEVIANVFKFMREEAEKGITIPLANFKQRLITATGISDKLTVKSSKRNATWMLHQVSHFHHLEKTEKNKLPQTLFF